MKTSLLFPAILACALLTTQTLAATDAAAGWQAELAAAQQAAHQDAGGRARAGAILHAVLDASRPSPPAGANRDAAAAQAAYSTLVVLYPLSLAALDARLAAALTDLVDTPAAISAGTVWGQHVAAAVLAEQDDAVFLNPTSFAVKAPTSAEPTQVPAANALTRETVGPGRYRVSVLAGARERRGYVDAIGADARFDNPTSVAVDAAGNAYVAEETLGIIRKITPAGVVTTLAGAAGQPGSQDGVGAAARFNGPRGLAVDRAGNVYVADLKNHTVRKVDPSGQVTTVAGAAGQPDSIDGARGIARFNSPGYVAVDDAGTLFVSDLGWPGKIRQIAPDGTVSTLTVRIPYYETNLTPWFSVYEAQPGQLAVDHAGNLYAIYADAWADPDAVKLVPTGGGNYLGTILRPNSSSVFTAYALGVDDADNAYVMYSVGPVCKYAPGGPAEIRYFAGNSGGYAWGVMTVDRSGRLFLLPGTGPTEEQTTVETGEFDAAATGPTILMQPSDTAVERGQYGGFFVFAGGDPTLTYQWYLNGNPVKGGTLPQLTVTSVQADSVGLYTVVLTDRAGSVTSRGALLSLKEATTPSAGVIPVSSGSGSSPAAPSPASAGAGSFDAGLALAVLGLLAAAARRARSECQPDPEFASVNSRPNFRP